jgi:hypothetical protein
MPGDIIQKLALEGHICKDRIRVEQFGFGIGAARQLDGFEAKLLAVCQGLVPAERRNPTAHHAKFHGKVASSQ